MLKAIDLFSGAGGLSFGLRDAGWDVVAALEYDKVAMATHAHNMPEMDHLWEDVRQVSFKRYRGAIDLVAGGPPCQPFSVSGKQLGHGDLRDMVPEFVRAVREVKPKAFLMENVAGLATSRFRSYLEERLDDLRALGYDVQWTVLNAADYGVPQKRQRLIIVGTSEPTEFAFPEPTHGGRRKRHVSVARALKGCPEDEPNTARVVYAKNPILRRSPYAGMLLNGKGRPLDMKAPSFTIPASAGGNRTHILDPDGVIERYHEHLISGGKPRRGDVEGCSRLTVRQSARLQAFPDNFEFVGRKSQRYAQIGNAVPPALATIVATQLKRALSG
ncbi:DNA cytosine methyltransferase [Oleiagrimonas citrea]|uniref:Cytosine-specific methyltransferase n=1 Tax=Oleiagrimonas citrea TaxID=1665687 RepID=A0A846ZMA3_9GAMM|nr:DNA cytosine methyltransferase [Oleiagrimonas citrea]NKZ39354.1 DNA cytosine methyltransferase [Oleiagrimonas citrea]